MHLECKDSFFFQSCFFFCLLKTYIYTRQCKKCFVCVCMCLGARKRERKRKMVHTVLVVKAVVIPETRPLWRLTMDRMASARCTCSAYCGTWDESKHGVRGSPVVRSPSPVVTSPHPVRRLAELWALWSGDAQIAKRTVTSCSVGDR